MVKLMDSGEPIQDWINTVFIDEEESLSIEPLEGNKSQIEIKVQIVTNDDFRQIRGSLVDDFK